MNIVKCISTVQLVKTRLLSAMKHKDLDNEVVVILVFSLMYKTLSNTLRWNNSFLLTTK